MCVFFSRVWSNLYTLFRSWSILESSTDFVLVSFRSLRLMYSVLYVCMSLSRIFYFFRNFSSSPSRVYIFHHSLNVFSCWFNEHVNSIAVHIPYSLTCQWCCVSNVMISLRDVVVMVVWWAASKNLSQIGDCLAEACCEDYRSCSRKTHTHTDHERERKRRGKT